MLWRLTTGKFDIGCTLIGQLSAMDVGPEFPIQPKSLFLVRGARMFFVLFLFIAEDAAVLDIDLLSEARNQLQTKSEETCFLTLTLGGEEHRYFFTHQDEFAWEVSHFEGRQLDLRVCLRRNVLFGFSQQMGETVIAVDQVIRQLRATSVIPSKWYQLDHRERPRSVVRLQLSLSSTAKENFDYLSCLHQSMIRLMLEDDNSSISESESGGLMPPVGLVGGINGYVDSIAQLQRCEKLTNDELFDAADVVTAFNWVIGPTSLQFRESLSFAESSIRRIIASRDLFLRQFLSLCNRKPHLMELFGYKESNRDSASFGMIYLMLEALRNPHIVIANLRDVSARNVLMGMEIGDYGLLGNVLMESIRSIEEPSGYWNQELEFAWRLAYTLIASTLIELSRPQYMKMGLLPPILGIRFPGENTVSVPAVCSFNERFQRAVEKIWKNYNDGAAWMEISSVANDFEEAALLYGRVIILEQFLPDHLKSIKPLYFGKIGGVKYCHAGIFFKFAIADGSVIRSMEGAAKVAGHELKGSSCYFHAGIPSLHVPLVSCIDFAGFRLVAMCELPISSSTLVVGTNDGGKTLVASDLVLLVQLKDVSRVLNLKEHRVGSLILSSAADLEGHFSPIDGRRYVVDFSRVMPPDPVSASTNGEARFVRLLRPELVQQFSEPLNPDTFSGFHGLDNGQEIEDEHALRMAHEMLKNFCHTVAKEVTEKVAECETPDGLSMLLESLSRIFHSHGVNMRMMGFIFTIVHSPWARIILSVEMASRIIKRIVRSHWRKGMSSTDYAMYGPLIQETANCFNDTFMSATFWHEIIYPEMERYFEFAWTPIENTITIDTPARQTLLSSRETATVEPHPARILRRHSLSDESLSMDLLSAQKQKQKPANIRTRTLRNRIVSSPVTSSPHNKKPEQAQPSKYYLWKPLYENRVVRSLLFNRLCCQLGVTFSARVTNTFLLGEAIQSMVVIDASDVTTQPRLKSIKIVAQSRAMSMVAKADMYRDKKQFIDLASAFFETALDAPLISCQILRSYAECLMRYLLGNVLETHPPNLLGTELGGRVETLFCQALRANPRDAATRCAYAKWRERCGDNDGARLHLLKSIMLTPDTLSGVDDYLRLLIKLQMHAEAKTLEGALSQRESQARHH
jgi:hemoglobin-like flavoprotein